MPNELERIVKKIRREHYANPPALKADLDAAIARGVPAELLSFYAVCNGAFIGRGSDFSAPNDQRYRLMIPCLGNLRTAQVYGYISERSPLFDLSQHWWQIVSYGDANWLACDNSPGAHGRIIDLFHETVGDLCTQDIVATGLIDMLNRILERGGVYWFSGFESLGTI